MTWDSAAAADQIGPGDAQHESRNQGAGLTRPAIAIAHDYLTQRGGAERVVLTLLKAFPDAPSTPRSTTPTAPTRSSATPTIVTSPLNRVVALPPRSPRSPCRSSPPPRPGSHRRRRHHRRPAAAGRTASRPPVTRSSTATTRPAGSTRRDEYLGGARLARTPRSPAARHAAGTAPVGPSRGRSASIVYLANSRGRRSAASQRHLRARRRGARVRRTAWTRRPPGADPELGDCEPGYALVVSRLLPYKNVDARHRGRAPHGRRSSSSATAPRRPACARALLDHVRILSGLTDAQLRWVYARAGVLVAAEPRGLRAHPPRGRRHSAYRPWPCVVAVTSTPSSRVRPGCSSTTRNPRRSPRPSRFGTLTPGTVSDSGRGPSSSARPTSSTTGSAAACALAPRGRIAHGRPASD